MFFHKIPIIKNITHKQMTRFAYELIPNFYKGIACFLNYYRKYFLKGFSLQYPITASLEALCANFTETISQKIHIITLPHYEKPFKVAQSVTSNIIKNIENLKISRAELSKQPNKICF